MHAPFKKWCVRSFFLILAVVLCGSWYAGSRLTSSANRSVAVPRTRLPISNVTFASESGATIAAWHCVHPRSTSTVILAHPIRGNRLSMLSRAELLYANGYSTLLIDLQAHGESQGTTITIGHLERHDVQAAVDFTKRASPEQKIAVIGRSLGGAAALLASPLEIDALVIESVYSTIEEATFNRLSRRVGVTAHVAAPLLTAQLPIRLGIPSKNLRPIDYTGRVDCPLLILSGVKDERTTAAETKKMFAAAKAPKQMVLFPFAGHIDLFAHDPRLYSESVLTFLEQALQ